MTENKEYKEKVTSALISELGVEDTQDYIEEIEFEYGTEYWKRFISKEGKLIEDKLIKDIQVYLEWDEI